MTTFFIEVTAVWQETPRKIGLMLISVAHIKVIAQIPDSEFTRIVYGGGDAELEQSVMVRESYNNIHAMIIGQPVRVDPKSPSLTATKRL